MTLSIEQRLKISQVASEAGLRHSRQPNQIRWDSFKYLGLLYRAEKLMYLVRPDSWYEQNKRELFKRTMA